MSGTVDHQKEILSSPFDKDVLASLLSGAMAGAVAKTTIAPLDRTKIYFQVTENGYRLRKAARFIKNTYSNEGVLTLWRGNSATMARVMPFAAIQFSTYEKYKILLRPAGSVERILPPGRRFMAGSLSGATATLLTYPLDMVRARMAVSRKQLYKGLIDTFKLIITKEGVLTLYRGIVPTLMGIIPYAGSSFFTYETLKQAYRDRHGELTTVPRLAAGAVAGLVGQTSSYPLDVVRRRMQTESVVGSIRYTGILQTMTLVLKREGIRGLYKGVSMNWIKGPVSVTVSFNVYETVHRWMKASRY